MSTHLRSSGVWLTLPLPQRFFGRLVFNGTFSTNMPYRALSAQEINPTTYLLYGRARFKPRSFLVGIISVTERRNGMTASRSGFYKNMIIYGAERTVIGWNGTLIITLCLT